jgi:hypothetical protein
MIDPFASRFSFSERRCGALSARYFPGFAGLANIAIQYQLPEISAIFWRSRFLKITVVLIAYFWLRV